MNHFMNLKSIEKCFHIYRGNAQFLSTAQPCVIPWTRNRRTKSLPVEHLKTRVKGVTLGDDLLWKPKLANLLFRIKLL